MELSNRSHIPRLTQDLIDKVIDQLSADKVSLSKSSLVCRSWTYLCRLRLFESLDISLPTKKREAGERAKELSSFLEQTPEIARCIRHLRIQGVWPHGGLCRRICYLAEDLLAAVLAKLPRLLTLELDETVKYAPVSGAFNVMEPFPLELERLSLMGTYVGYYSEPGILRLLALFSKVRHLLKNDRYSLWSDPEVPAPERRNLPNRLEIQRFTLMDCRDIENMRHSFKSFQQTVSIHSLVELELAIPIHFAFRVPLEIVPLQKWQALRSIAIHLDVGLGPDNVGELAIPVLCMNIFDCLPETLRGFKLQFEMEEEQKRAQFVEAFRAVDFAPLERTLDRLPDLRLFTICVNARQCNLALEEELLRSKLPRLARKGVLLFCNVAKWHGVGGIFVAV